VTDASVLAATEAWEDAYLRFETPEEEIGKFMKRLRAVGAAGWPRDARVLEIFCGRGNGLVALERLGFTRLHGVDLSPRLLRLYRGRGRCSAGDCRALPIRSRSHDVAIVQGGLHHLPDVMTDLPVVLGEVQRVLKPGGLFVVVEPWLTPFLTIVHAACDSPARRLWGRLDALATMIQYERDTYFRWLGNPGFVRAQLAAGFATQLRREAWGKLVFAGRNTGGALT
jgi:ubiquinone/menaquinone biosynthesis C-methylase UbiE